MKSERGNLREVAVQISGALDILVRALEDGIDKTYKSLVAQDFDPEEDLSYLSHGVRRHVREQLKAHFPNLDQMNPNMSPIHLWLGPHELKMLRGQDGRLPRPRTDARKEWYEDNDNGVLALNVFPPDGLVTVEEDASTVEEAHLVLLWESDGPVLTRLKLCHPSMDKWPGEDVVLYSVNVAEPDLTFEKQTKEGAESGKVTDGTQDGEQE